MGIFWSARWSSTIGNWQGLRLGTHVLRSLSRRFGEGSIPAEDVDCAARLRGVFDFVGDGSTLAAADDELDELDAARLDGSALALAFPFLLTARGTSADSTFTGPELWRRRVVDGPATTMSSTSTLIANDCGLVNSVGSSLTVGLRRDVLRFFAGGASTMSNSALTLTATDLRPGILC